VTRNQEAKESIPGCARAMASPVFANDLGTRACWWREGQADANLSRSPGHSVVNHGDIRSASPSKSGPRRRTARGMRRIEVSVACLSRDYARRQREHDQVRGERLEFRGERSFIAAARPEGDFVLIDGDRRVEKYIAGCSARRVRRRRIAVHPDDGEVPRAPALRPMVIRAFR